MFKTTPNTKPGRIRMIDLDVLIARISFLFAVAMSVVAIGLYYNNTKLTTTNAELSYWATAKLDSLDAVVALLRRSAAEVREALLDGSSVELEQWLLAEEK